MKRLRIAIVCPYDFFRFGGVQEATRAQIKYLLNDGYEVDVIAPRTRNSQTKKGVITVGRGFKVKTPLGTVGEISYISSRIAKRTLRNGRYDVIHFHEPWVPFFVPTFTKVARKLNIPTLATFHAMHPETTLAGFLAWLLKYGYGWRLIRRIDKLVAVSEPATRLLRTMTKRQIKLIPNAVDLAIYSTEKIKNHPLCEKSKFNIVYVGRLEKRKGVSHLLDAVKLAEEDRQIKLLIAGDGHLREELSRKAFNLGLQDTHFLGFISEGEKLSLLKSADLACFPALFGESFGIVLIEAMALGTPVIAGNNPGYASVMKDIGRNTLVNPKNTALFSRLIIRYIDDKKFRKEIAKRSLEKVRKYGYQSNIDQYKELYNSLADKS